MLILYKFNPFVITEYLDKDVEQYQLLITY